MNGNVAQRNQKPGNKDKNGQSPKHFQPSFPQQVPSFQFGQNADILQCTLAVLHAQPPHWETKLLETAAAAAFKRSKSLGVAQVQEFKWAGSKTGGSIQPISNITYIIIYITILVIGDHHPYAWKQEHIWTTRKDSEALWWILFVGCWQLKITHRYKSTLTSIGISLNRSATEHCCRRRELRHLQKGESILIRHPRQMTLKISEQYWVDWAPQLT